MELDVSIDIKMAKSLHLEKINHGQKMLLHCFESLRGRTCIPSKMIAGLLVIHKVVTNVGRRTVNRVHVLHLLKQADCVTYSRFYISYRLPKMYATTV